MAHSILKATLLASILSTTANALVWGTVTPYQDSQCTNALEYSYNGKYLTGEDKEVSNQPWTLGMGVAAEHVGNKWHKYTNVKFENASSPDGNIGNYVYWDTGPIDRGCRAVFMKPYAGPVGYGSMADDQPPGNVILSTTKEGCYFTQIPVDSTFYMTFCCNGGCDHFSGDTRSPNHKKRSDLAKKTEVLETRNSGSLAARASAANALNKRGGTCNSDDTTCINKVWAGCKIDPGEARSEAGLQVAVSGIVSATSGPGSSGTTVAVTQGFTVGTSTSVSDSTSYETSEGLSVTLEAGVTWPMEATVATTASLTLTQGVDHTTGHDSSFSKEVTTSYTLPLVPGTSGFLSFTPYYQCYMPTITCGRTEMTGPVNICYPQLLKDGSPQGEYTIVQT